MHIIFNPNSNSVTCDVYYATLFNEDLYSGSDKCNKCAVNQVYQLLSIIRINLALTFLFFVISLKSTQFLMRTMLIGPSRFLVVLQPGQQSVFKVPLKLQCGQYLPKIKVTPFKLSNEPVLRE